MPGVTIPSRRVQKNANAEAVNPGSATPDAQVIYPMCLITDNRV